MGCSNVRVARSQSRFQSLSSRPKPKLRRRPGCLAGRRRDRYRSRDHAWPRTWADACLLRQHSLPALDAGAKPIRTRGSRHGSSSASGCGRRLTRCGRETKSGSFGLRRDQARRRPPFTPADDGLSAEIGGHCPWARTPASSNLPSPRRRQPGSNLPSAQKRAAARHLACSASRVDDVLSGSSCPATCAPGVAKANRGGERRRDGGCPRYTERDDTRIRSLLPPADGARGCCSSRRTPPLQPAPLQHNDERARGYDRPPSTLITCPEIQPAWGLARNRTAAAMSSAWPSRRRWMPSRIRRCPSSP